MKMNPHVVFSTSAIFTPLFTAFALDTVRIMIPWIIAMVCVILTDLAAGVRKSRKLGVHISWSTAIRETLGKIVVYFAWVVTAAVIDVAANGGAVIAKWCCLLVIIIEGGSILSNILKPHGIELSVKGVLKFFMMRSPLAADPMAADEILDEKKLEEMRKREEEKWNHKGKKGGRR